MAVDIGKYPRTVHPHMADDVYQSGERQTAPMQEFSMRAVAIGLIVLLVAGFVAYAIPALFTGL